MLNFFKMFSGLTSKDMGIPVISVNGEFSQAPFEGAGKNDSGLAY